MNVWIGIGRLTKDPEIRYSQNGTGIATFTLAVDRKFTNQNGEREADFIMVKSLNTKQSENIANYLTKGKMAAVRGELHINSFDGQDGGRKWFTEIIADLGGVKFLSPKDSNNDFGGSEINFTDDDIPF